MLKHNTSRSGKKGMIKFIEKYLTKKEKNRIKKILGAKYSFLFRCKALNIGNILHAIIVLSNENNIVITKSDMDFLNGLAEKYFNVWSNV